MICLLPTCAARSMPQNSSGCARPSLHQRLSSCAASLFSPSPSRPVHNVVPAYTVSSGHCPYNHSNSARVLLTVPSLYSNMSLFLDFIRNIISYCVVHVALPCSTLQGTLDDRARWRAWIGADRRARSADGWTEQVPGWEMLAKRVSSNSTDLLFYPRL